MPIDDDVARFSDLAFGSAVAVYLFALLLLIAEYASLSARALDAAEARRVLVAAGSTAPDRLTPGRIPQRPLPRR